MNHQFLCCTSKNRLPNEGLSSACRRFPLTVTTDYVYPYQSWAMLYHKFTYTPSYLNNCDTERALEANMTQLHNRELEGRIINDFCGFFLCWINLLIYFHENCLFFWNCVHKASTLYTAVEHISLTSTESVLIWIYVEIFFMMLISSLIFFQELNLDHCQLHVIKPDAFKGLHRLKKLSLKHNFIR